MHDPSVSLVVRVTPSAADARRGVVRLHPEVLDALGLRSWDAVTLTGARVTTALAAPAAPGVAPGQATVDDVILSNAGLTDGAAVVVAPARVAAARRVLLTGSRLARAGLTPETARLALLGKVVTGGDAVSLLPQDLEPAAGLDVAAARRRLAGAVGGAWTTELLTVAGTEPPGAVAVMPSTVVGWEGDGSWGAGRGGAAAWQQGGPTATTRQQGSPAGESGGGGPAGSGAGTAPGGQPDAAGGPSQQGGTTATSRQQGHLADTSDGRGPAPVAGGAEPVLDIDDLVGHADAARRLVEWLELTFRRPELLTRLGGSPRLGVLVAGAEGVGKATLVRSAAAAVGARCVELAAPAVAALEPASASTRVHDVIGTARAAARSDAPAVLLLTDVDALLPATDPPPLATLVLDALRAAITTSVLRAGRHVVVARVGRPPAACARPRRPRARPAAAGPAGAHRAAASPAGRRADRRRHRPQGGRRAHARVRRRGPGRRPPGGRRDRRAAARRRPGRVGGHRHRRGARPGHPAGPARRGRRRAAHLDVVVGEPADRRDHPRPGRRHGRGQAGAHRGGAVAAALPRLVRPARRRPAARRARVRPAGVRQDVPAPRARRDRAAQRARREGCRAARQVRGRVGARRPRAVPPGGRRRPRARVPRRGRRARARAAASRRTPVSRTGSSPRCSRSWTERSRCATSSWSARRTGPS